MKAFFPETCPKYPRSVMRTGDGIPAGRVADGQEHGGDEPAQQDSRGRPEQDGESGSCLPYASVRNAYGRHAAGDARPRIRKERKPS